MATEDLGHGMTADDVMLQRTRWLYQGGPVPPGLEDRAKEVKQEGRNLSPSLLMRFARWLRSF